MKGRSQITVDGRTYVLPKEEAEVERVVRRAHEAREKLDAASDEFKAVRDELIELAREWRGKSNTVALGRIDLVAKVRFTQSVGFDSTALLDARAILGEKEFSRLFSTRTVFTARKALELFLKESGNVAAKNAIQKATTVTEAAPKVSFEQIDD